MFGLKEPGFMFFQALFFISRQTPSRRREQVFATPKITIIAGPILVIS
jgi:hypothetical protein